jgi:HD-GYP domain-containing protein (c-di-GMP phosphodiesterase class II)
MSPQHGETESLWTARPAVARSIRVFVFVAPLLISVVVAWALSAIAPNPATFAAGVLRWVLIAFVSTLVLLAVDKLARRLLPLATLFGLTLAFPDQAPSRYHLALRNGSTAQLRVRIAEARAGKLGDTPEEAAERVLELVMALSVHDRLTRGHSERVRAYTQMIGEEMGLTDTELDRLRWAGLLHDVGKLMISGDILNKEGKLTAEEFETIKQHPEFGRRLVAPLNDWMGEAARAVWEHHERWDGNGYPRGLATTDISLAGRIVSVADAYDVMTSARSYKKPVAPAAARAELTKCSGTQFDPAVVRAFMNLSLGRLRFALGALTWLAQLPMFPSAVAASATQGAATAATAIVGAAAASMGLGLSGEPMLPQPDPVAAQELVIAGGSRDPYEVDTASRSNIVTDGAVPVALVDGIGSGESAGGAAAAQGGGPDVGDDRDASGPVEAGTTTTTTTIASTTTIPQTVVIQPGITTTVAPVTTTAATPAPTTTVASVDTTTTVAPATTPAPTTSVPAPPTTRPRPGWLPAAGVPTTFYFEMLGRVHDNDPEDWLLGMRTSVPNRTTTLSFDPDRDGWAGLTLARTQDGITPVNGLLTFAWGGPDAAGLAGPTMAQLYVGTKQVVPAAISVRARLLACDAAGACAPIAESAVDTVAGVVALPLAFDFGIVDAVIPAGGTVRVALDVPESSTTDIVVFADTNLTPSAITLTFP